MKKMMIALAIMTTTLSFAASAKDERPVIRITVGQDKNQDTHRRIQRLEEAVRDLQDMVYDLQDDRRDRVITEYVCVIKTNFDGSFVGRGPTKIEAQANAVAACKKGRASFCESTQQSCEVTEVRSRR